MHSCSWLNDYVKVHLIMFVCVHLHEITCQIVPKVATHYRSVNNLMFLLLCIKNRLQWLFWKMCNDIYFTHIMYIFLQGSYPYSHRGVRISTRATVVLLKCNVALAHTRGLLVLK